MLPEIIVISAAVLILVVDLFLQEKQRRILAPIAMLGILSALVVMWFVLPHQGTVFGGRFEQNTISLWFKTFFLVSGFFTIGLSVDLLNGQTPHRMKGIGHRGEFYTILLWTMSGMMYLISARDIVTLYVSLELATIPLFLLVAWRREDESGAEAGLKYVVVGALASALILYGLGMLYGITGHTDIAGITQKISYSPVFYMAAALLLAGIGFKMALVPFHMWAADVYQGAPTPITTYLSVASKATGLAFMFQVFFGMMAPQLSAWTFLFAIIATLSMTLGNVVAIVQENIKRFMAFSSISQAGYILMGFLGVSSIGVSAVLFYMLVYIFTNLVVFGIIVWFSNNTGKEKISDYRGLARTNPLFALAMMLGLFSLAGIPPLSGFVGKFFLFSVAAKAGYHWLVAVAAINSTVSLYYYLRIVRQMYIEAPEEGAKALPSSSSIRWTIAVATIATVVLGVMPHVYEKIHHGTRSWSEALVKTVQAKQAHVPEKTPHTVPRVVKKVVAPGSQKPYPRWDVPGKAQQRVAPGKTAIVGKPSAISTSLPSSRPANVLQNIQQPTTRPSVR